MTKPIFISFFIMCLLLACKKEEVKVTYTANQLPLLVPADTATSKTYLALGDSYTIGQSVAVADRFPVQAVKYLKDHGIKFNDPEIIAQTGWTTANLLSTLAFSAPLKSQYDIVTLLIGVNNQYQHRTQAEYTDQFSTLLTKALQYAGNKKSRVIVLSIPDYGVTPYAGGSDHSLIAREIDSFNVINKTIASQMGVHYLDITPASRLASSDRSLIATDGLHPSGLQYKVWAEGLVPIIKTALQ